jgi:nitrate reductase beta subunit
MKIKAQFAMVLNLDKCIGCHTCSVTCKNVWTNRPGAEYMWFNNVETRPGRGYPRDWEDNERLRGGWKLDRKGKLKLRAGGKLRKALNIFHNPDLPEIDDYYEPWTYDYEALSSPGRNTAVTAAALPTQRRQHGDQLGPELEDDLARSARPAAAT